MIRFASLGSGSKGNATLIESGPKVSDTRILLDCGFSIKETERRLSRLERDAKTLTAIVVTHEHFDHISGVARLSRKYNIPVWLTVGTWNNCKDKNFIKNFIDLHSEFELGRLSIAPFPVPHDASEPCQFIFSDGVNRLGVATDLGSSTPHIRKQLNKLDALLLECNYDEVMLRAGSYPQSLKNRVIGDKGHLDNNQATQLLKNLNMDKLKHIVGMHVSEKNNTPKLAIDALCKGLNCESNDVSLANQCDGFGWRELI